MTLLNKSPVELFLKIEDNKYSYELWDKFDSSYSYKSLLMQKFEKAKLLNSKIQGHRRQYFLTKRGKLLQQHLRTIVEQLLK